MKIPYYPYINGETIKLGMLDTWLLGLIFKDAYIVSFSHGKANVHVHLQHDKGLVEILLKLR